MNTQREDKLILDLFNQLNEKYQKGWRLLCNGRKYGYKFFIRFEDYEASFGHDLKEVLTEALKYKNIWI